MAMVTRVIRLSVLALRWQCFFLLLCSLEPGSHSLLILETAVPLPINSFQLVSQSQFVLFLMLQNSSETILVQFPFLSLYVRVNFSTHPKVSLLIFCWYYFDPQDSNFCNCFEVPALNLPSFHTGLSKEIQVPSTVWIPLEGTLEAPASCLEQSICHQEVV